jgi:bacteriocin biosynthesis cyclodehydratase domain-containing protein
MIYRLDSTLPLVWRTPHSLQLGVDPAVIVIDDVTEAQEKMLAALAVGVTAAGLRLVANGNAAKRDELLELVAPVLERAPEERPTREVTLCGGGEFVEILARALGSDAVHVTIVRELRDLPDTRPDLAIIVAAHVVAPAFHGVWLRRDVPHLAVVFSESASVVGPVVDPGTGPCLLCLELHRRDADPSWPAIATQLLGRGRAADSPALLLESAAEVCRIVAAHGSGPAGSGAGETSVRIDAASGERVTTVWTVHPECGCRGIPLLADWAPAATARPRETDWAAAALDPA